MTGLEPVTSSLPQGSALPLSYIGIHSWAEDEAQTRDPQLGRLMLYQLSYFRRLLWARWIRTTEGVSQQILQSAPFGHSGICPYISLYKTLNLHLTLYHTHLSFSEECTRLSKIESVRNGCKFRH